MKQRLPIRRLCWLSLAWTVPPLLLTFSLLSRSPPKESFWEGMRFFTFQALLWYPWIIWSLLAWKLLARWPLTKGFKKRHVVAHVVVALVLAVTMNAYQVLLELWLAEGFLEAFNMVIQIHFARIFGPVRLLMVAILYGIVLVLGVVFSLAQQNQQQRLQMAHDRLQMLTIQLQPHFLFNTLNAIATLMEEDLEGARTVIARLGDLLRSSLAHGEDQEISLGEEWAILECYLSIQRVRFPDRLKVKQCMDPAATEARVPPLLLQPLVENAIRHGLKKDGGQVTIQAQIQGNKLQLMVADDGPGFDEGSAVEGIGLANCRARLSVLYGDAAQLLCVNPVGGGARVEVILPLHIPNLEPASK